MTHAPEFPDGDATSRREQIAVASVLQKIAVDLDDLLEELVGHRLGFALVVYTDGRTQYVSNCKREDNVAALDEYLAYLRATTDEDDVLAASIQ